jgi:hypothetical protein
MGRKMNAYKAGYEHGKSAGSWVIDGNTSEDAAKKVLRGFADGDPAIMDMCRCPLSGEWAGESISELSSRFGIDLDDDDNASQFEDGFYQGYWDAVIELASLAASK